MTVDIEETAIETVARTVSAAPKQSAMAAALARIAGNTVAKLINHDAACRLHTELARRHLILAGKGK